MRPMEERKEVIRLYTEEHHGYKTIAKEMGLSTNTVKSWIRRYRCKNGLILCGRRGVLPKRYKIDSNRMQSSKDYEKRIAQLEMEVELLRDFLSAEERRSIKK
jgi:transposase-like protein